MFDDRLHGLLHPDATLQKLADGAVHSEGPVYFAHDDSMVYSDAHDNRLLRWRAADGVNALLG